MSSTRHPCVYGCLPGSGRAALRQTEWRRPLGAFGIALIFSAMPAISHAQSIPGAIPGIHQGAVARRMARLCRDLRRRALFAAGADRPQQRQKPAYRLALEIARHGDQGGAIRTSARASCNEVDAADDRRGALHLDLAVAGRRHRRRHRRDQVGVRSEDLRKRPRTSRQSRLAASRRRLLAQRRRRTHRDPHRVRADDCARRQNRQAGAVIRQRRPDRSDGRPAPAGRSQLLHHDLAAGDRARRHRGRLVRDGLVGASGRRRPAMSGASTSRPDACSGPSTPSRKARSPAPRPGRKTPGRKPATPTSGRR